MDTPAPVPSIARRPAGGGRRVALGLTLAVVAACLGVAAPTALGQTAPSLLDTQAYQVTDSNRDARRVCRTG
jgi:hypothetical protein